MADSDFLDALVHYRTKFPTLQSLGESAAAWTAELAAVAPGAFDAITGTNINLEGGSVGGILNFRQKYLVRALHARRGELDEDYVNPYTVPAPDFAPYKRIGSVVTLNPLP